MDTDLINLLRIDVTPKEMEQLKQTLKKCQRLDYSNLPREEKSNFDKFFLNKLREIQLEVLRKQENYEVVNMHHVFTQVMDLMETQIKYIQDVNSEMSRFKNTSLRPKGKSRSYKKENVKAF